MQVPLLAQTSPALLCAILAISARQKERKDASDGKSTPQKSFDSLELYQEAIRLLTPLLQAHDQAVIPICVILCCLEMMSASARDWRRHLEGCAALFDAFEVHGFCGGLLQAVFWCHARMGMFAFFCVHYFTNNLIGYLDFRFMRCFNIGRDAKYHHPPYCLVTSRHGRVKCPPDF